MQEIVKSIFFIFLGAVIGTLMSYIASYQLQLRKWRAEAALLRKEHVYGPIFDEMVIKVLQLRNYRGWVKASTMHRFSEWDKHRHTNLGLMVPDKVRKSFETFSETCRLYNNVGRDLYQSLKTNFPKRHFDVDDWAVAMLLADKALVAPDDQKSVVIDHLLEQRPTLEGLEGYWTDSRLQDLEAKVFELKEFKNLEGMHQKYSSEIKIIKNDLQIRIERIVKRYQTPLKGL